MKRNILMTSMLLTLTSMVGCNKTEQGASFGAGIGALAGQAIGGDTEGTLIGAGIGALVGGAIGNDQSNGGYNDTGAVTSRSTRTTKVLNPDGTYTTTGTETTNSVETVDGYQGFP